MSRAAPCFAPYSSTLCTLPARQTKQTRPLNTAAAQATPGFDQHRRSTLCVACVSLSLNGGGPGSGICARSGAAQRCDPGQCQGTRAAPDPRALAYDQDPSGTCALASLHSAMSDMLLSPPPSSSPIRCPAFSRLTSGCGSPGQSRRYRLVPRGPLFCTARYENFNPLRPP